jgi:plasmid stability protein
MTEQMLKIEKGGSLIVVLSTNATAIENTPTGSALQSAFKALGYPAGSFSSILIHAHSDEANRRELLQKLLLTIEEIDPLAVLALDTLAAEYLLTSYNQLVASKSSKLFAESESCKNAESAERAEDVFLNGRKSVFLSDFVHSLTDDTKKRADWILLKRLNLEGLIKINT